MCQFSFRAWIILIIKKNPGLLWILIPHILFCKLAYFWVLLLLTVSVSAARRETDSASCIKAGFRFLFFFYIHSLPCVDLKLVGIQCHPQGHFGQSFLQSPPLLTSVTKLNVPTFLLKNTAILFCPRLLSCISESLYPNLNIYCKYLNIALWCLSVNQYKV